MSLCAALPGIVNGRIEVTCLPVLVGSCGLLVITSPPLGPTMDSLNSPVESSGAATSWLRHQLHMPVDAICTVTLPPMTLSTI